MIGTARQIIARLAETQDLDKQYELKEHRAKRTLSQNAYYWVLVSKIADKMRLPKSEVHNRLLRDFGQLLIVDGKAARVMLPDSDETEKQTLRMDTVHMKPTSQVRAMGDNVIYRTYVILRGSSDYNTQEMTVLLDGCIQEAQQQGIETLTPRELEEMRANEKHN